MDQKILWLAVNAKYSHTSLAVRYLREAVPGSDILELTINHQLLAMLSEIYEQHPKVLGIACYIWNIGLVQQLLDQLSAASADLTVELPVRAGENWGISESARGSNLHYVALDGAGRIDRIFVRSASYPNWPALPIAVQGDIIPDFPLINKSFELCYACLDR